MKIYQGPNDGLEVVLKNCVIFQHNNDGTFFSDNVFPNSVMGQVASDFAFVHHPTSMNALPVGLVPMGNGLDV